MQEVRDLFNKGKIQGYLLYDEVTAALPSEITDPEQIEDIMELLEGMGIKILKTNPETSDDERQ